ncbi:hypothetical protein IID22_01380 [Patescibacteria group bacterium]|nr:hypothetical protein [Patescibacteria group bacterium]
MTKLNAKELRKSEPTSKELKKIKRNPIYLVLDEILDTYNVGSLFRLADAIAAEKMYLCGKMEYPPNSRIHKAAVGTETWVPWTAKSSTFKAVRELKKNGVQIIAVEQHKKAISYTDLGKKLKSLQHSRRRRLYVAIVVGHETKGIDEKVLKEADVIVELPMHGINKSFNVWGSATVVAYKVLESI